MGIPSTEVVLDKPRKLRLSMTAMIEFEERTGHKLIGLDLQKMDNVCDLLWIMLKQDEPELTREQTLELIEKNVDAMDDIIHPVWRAAQSAFSGKKIEESGKRKNV